MHIPAKKFFSIGFTCCCFVPLGLFTVLYIANGDWLTAAWQAIMLIAACVIRYQHCCISALTERYIAALEDLREEAEVHIALIEYIKELLPNEDTETKTKEKETK